MLLLAILHDFPAISLCYPADELFALGTEWHSWTLFKSLNGSSTFKMKTKSNSNLNILGPNQVITRQEESLSREKGTKI